MTKKVIFVALLIILSASTLFGTTYYSRSSGQFNTTTRWNTVRDGSGTSHDATWTGNHTYYIQSGHSITRASGSQNIGSSSSNLIIEDGGTYTNGSGPTGTITTNVTRVESGGQYIANATGQAITNFTIYGTGKYVHNTGAATIPGVTRNFANSTNGGNGNGTVEIQNQGTSPITSGITWGNVIINNTTTTSAIGNAAAFADVQGDFKVLSTNGYEYRFMAAQTTSHTIKGDLLIEGGTLVFKSGSGDATVNVDKNVKISGGTLVLTSSGGITLNVKEQFEVTSGSFLASSSSSAVTTMNLEGKLDAGGATNFRAYNGTASGEGYLNINFTNTQNLGRSSLLKLITGMDRYYCKWNIKVGSGRTITLNSDIEMGATNNSTYQYVTFTVDGGGTLVPGSYIIKNGSGTYNSSYEPRFTLATNGNMEIANSAGITSSGSNGSVQVTGTRTFNTDSNSIVYKGTAAQVTGNGYTGSKYLTINNSSGVTLSANTTVSNDLLLISGALAISTYTLAVGGTTTVSGGSIAGGTGFDTDGYSDSATYISITANDVNIKDFSISTAINNSLWPGRIKRYWTINGTQANTKSYTFTWTSADDEDYDWTGIPAAVFQGTTNIGGVGISRSLTADVDDLSSKSTFTIGREDEDPLPIELTSFTASPTPQGHVQLLWVTQSESNVHGFYVYRGLNDDLASAELISPLISATNTSTMQTYVYTDVEITDPGIYNYWLQNLDLDGGGEYHGPIAYNFTSPNTNINNVIPLVTRIDHVYPNPFNPLLYVQYTIAIESDIELKIYNTKGQLVNSAQPGKHIAGNYRYTWNGRDYSGNLCSSGTYLIQLRAGGDYFYKKAVLLK